MMPVEIRKILVREVPLEATFPLRKSVLRPHTRGSEVRFPLDDAASTIHLAAVGDDRVVGVTTAIHEPPPGSAHPAAWRLRGVAVRPEHQGIGIGRKLLRECERRVRAAGGEMLWCNARTNVIEFYERLDFVVASDTFELEGIGPHVQMRKTFASDVEPLTGGDL